MANKRYKSKLDKLEKIKQQIKDEERKLEQELGKFVLKTFDATHEDIEDIKEKIEELYLLYNNEENKTKDVEKNYSNEQEINTAHVGV